MKGNRRRAAIGAAVTFGILGGSLIGVGGLGLAAADGEKPVCPTGSSLYRSAGDGPAVPISDVTSPELDLAGHVVSASGGDLTSPEMELAGVQVAADPTDPFVSGTPVDPESYLCIQDTPSDVREVLRAPAPVDNGVGVPVTEPVAQPIAEPVTEPVVEPGSGEVAPYPTPGEGSTPSVDDGTGAGYDPGGETQNPPVVPVDEPSTTPAPGMVPLPGSAPAPTPDAPVTDPSTPPVATPTPSVPTVPTVPDSSIDGPDDPNPENPGDGILVPGKNGDITRAAVIGRAVSWVLQQVPYSQTSWWSDANGVYRQDCSGYVSMAWGLDQKVNYWTGNLATVSHRIASKDLRVGDALLLPRSHVVLFAGWANSAKTKFHLYEEYSRGKPARYVTDASLSYYLDRGYGAYRYDNINEVKVGKAGPQSNVYKLASFDTSAEIAEDPTAGVPWSPALAEQYDPESVAPAGGDGSVTPDAVPNLPIPTLVAAQQEVDARAGSANEPAASSSLMLLTSGGALLFLAVPLVVAARTSSRRMTVRQESA